MPSASGRGEGRNMRRLDGATEPLDRLCGSSALSFRASSIISANSKQTVSITLIFFLLIAILLETGRLRLMQIFIASIGNRPL